MGSRKNLNEYNIHTVFELNEEMYTAIQISKVVNRSRKVIMSLVKNPENCEKKKSSERPQSLITRRQITKSVGVNTNVKNVRMSYFIQMRVVNAKKVRSKRNLG